VRTNCGRRGEVRSSALWGTGNRGGETRSNALWGKGGRGALTALVAMLAISVPLAASSSGGGRHAVLVSPKRTWVSPGLLRGAEHHPTKLVRVIIQSTNGNAAAALQAFNRINRLDGHLNDREAVNRRLTSIGAVAVTVRADKLARLTKISSLTVTADVPVHVTSYSSRQLWPYESGVATGWPGPGNFSATAPTIAVVDSGIQANRVDFSGRVLANVNLSTLKNNSPGDGRGHGTFVAGIAAGGADGYTGATPQSNLVSLDVMDDTGVARTSDVIAACQWILDNKAKYNIRVANFSLHSSAKSNFIRDPLDRAVEQLWFNGVVVVAAAGNYGTADGPSGVPYAPGNDPFVLTVGAVDIGGTKSRSDDFPAPWSAWGYTLDGFAKPDLVAPGRYMVGPVPATSTLAKERPDKLVAPGYIQLSGTSFSAPVVSGAAAQILARHPEFTPDQVKGALMESAKPVEDAPAGSVGVGELQMGKAALMSRPPNPNMALDQFIKYGGRPQFDASGWRKAARSNSSWNAVSWDSVSWDDASFSVVSWQDVSWQDVSWQDVSSSDVSWSDVSWDDSSLEDVADDDTTQTGGYALTPEQAAEIMEDPALAPPLASLPADVASAVKGDTASGSGSQSSSTTDGASRSSEGRAAKTRVPAKKRGRERSRPSLNRGISRGYLKRGM